MVKDREAAAVALFAVLSALPAVRSSSRILQHWNDVAAENQPALFQTQVGHEQTRTAGFPSLVTMSFEIFLYVSTTEGSGDAPATQLNQLLDAIDTALAPSIGQAKNTLGGTCESVVISGRINTDEGTLGTQAVAVVPITITLARQ
jgi:hypothetical protein